MTRRSNGAADRLPRPVQPVPEPSWVTPPLWDGPADPTDVPAPAGPWRDRAACFTAWDVWFSDDPQDQALATTTCGLCPVRRQCLTTALAQGEEHGIWAGTTPQDRRLLLGRLRSGTPLPVLLDTLDHPAPAADDDSMGAAA